MVTLVTIVMIRLMFSPRVDGGVGQRTPMMASWTAITMALDWLEAEELAIRKIVEAEGETRAERNKRPTRERGGGWGTVPISLCCTALRIAEAAIPPLPLWFPFSLLSSTPALALVSSQRGVTEGNAPEASR